MKSEQKNLTQKQLKEWSKELIGKKFEIYWEPEELADKDNTQISTSSSSSSSSSSDGTPMIETSCSSDDDDNSSSYDADWYDGLIKSYSPRKRMFEVVFVGDDTIYEMNLKPEIVRPLSLKDDETSKEEEESVITQEGQHENQQQRENNDLALRETQQSVVGHASLEWKQHLVEKDFEIYWDVHKTAVFVMEDQRDEIGFDADWYEGKVQSYSIDNDTFQVSFTGEDCVYQMYLGPEVVRPSANAWIRRTKHLLSVNVDDEEWLCQLPPLSATLDRLDMIQNQIEASHDMNTEGDTSIKHFVRTMEEQIIIRDHLIVDSHDTLDDITTTSTKIRTEQYINHLIQCLKVNKQAFMWSHETKCTIAQLCKDHISIDHAAINSDEPGLQREEASSVPLEVNDVQNHILHGFHLYLRLMTMKIEVDVLQNNTKKRLTPSPPTSHQRHNISMTNSKKRRRRNTSLRYREFAMESSIQREISLDGMIDTIHASFDSHSNRSFWHLVLQWLEENSPVDHVITHHHPSLDIFHLLEKVLRKQPSRSKFLVHQISNSLHGILSSVWDKLVNWLKTSNKILGPTNLPCENELPYIDDSTSQSTCDQDDIKNSIALTSTDQLLRRFNLSSYKSKLEEKLHKIQEFERKAWSIIATCVNNDVKLPSTNTQQGIESKEEYLNDDIIYDLRNIRHEMETNHHVKNVSPIGCLTQESIEDAINLRLWIIRVHRIQNNRERSSLMNSLLSSQAIEISFDHVPTQSLIAPIVKSMKQNLQEKWFEFEQKNIPSLPLATLECDCEKACDRVLESLSRHTLITDCEEKLSILADILELKGMIQKVVSATPDHKIDFESIEATFRLLGEIKRGKSKRRRNLTASLILNKQCEAEMTEFTSIQLEKHVGVSQNVFVDMYNVGRTWTQSVKAMLKILQKDGSNFNAKSQMVDFTKIEELLKQYNDGCISCPSYFEQLRSAHGNVASWSERLTKVLPSVGEFCPIRCLCQLTELRSTRPKGVLMHPPRQLVNSWIELLKWYEDCGSALNTLESECETISLREPHSALISTSQTNVNHLIFRGLDLLKAHSIHPLQEFFNNLNFIEQGTSTSDRILLDKIQDQSEGQCLLDALITYDEDLGFNGVIVLCRSLLWQKSTVDFLTRRNTTSPITLKDAKVLFNHFERSKDNAHVNKILKNVVEETYSSLKKEVEKFEEIEINAKAMLDSLESIKEDQLQTDFLENLIEQMKATRDNIKRSYSGFRTDKEIENRINQKIRETVWLKNVLKYPTLVQRMNLKNLPQSYIDTSSLAKKISSQELIGLYDKMPHVQGCSDTGGLDAILQVLCAQLKQIKSDCDEWEERVQSKLPLSTRGLKRRKKINNELKGKGNDRNYHLITRKELEELMMISILEIVDMPLHAIVKRVYHNVSTIEDELKDILTSDIDSDDIDRTPIPTSPSLIGSNGEFCLFKLVGNHTFVEMQQRLRVIDDLCEELDDIKTTEVITIQWISSAVQWIESLSSLMVFGKKAKLELSLENAEDLAISGATVLLGVEDVVKKSILRHKISLYTNEKTRNFSVKIARGGTTHSMGAYVLRWIEACFNGLRGDIYATYEFTRSVEEFSSELDDLSIATIASLSEMKDNLFVTPTKEVIQSFAELNRNFGPQTDVGRKVTNTITDIVPQFNHRLLFEDAMTKK